MDSRLCSLTACLKNEKIQKGQSAICEGLEKYKKNTKIQIAFLDVMEKYKKNTKIQSVFFVFYLYCFRFFVFLPKNTKKYEKNTNAIAQKYKIQKKMRINNFKNTKYKKKIRTQNFKNTKYKEKTNSKISQRANPVFTVEIRKQIAKKIQNQPVVFPKPCSSDFVFLGCIFLYF